MKNILRVFVVHAFVIHLIKSYSHEHHLKVMVVYDYSMIKSHLRLHYSSSVEDHLRRYILTLMSTVAKIYSDASIGNHLQVSVVDIKRLSGENIFRNYPQNTLEQFCRWQRLNKRGANSYDVAILLTRQLCKDDHRCDTLGITRRNSMCHVHWSCAVVKDNGLAAAFTIAHELGHLLGLPHDDHEDCIKLSSNKNPEKRVMAATLDNDTHPWTWSNCSKQKLNQIFDAGKYKCLLNKPNENLLESLNINDNDLSSNRLHTFPHYYSTINQPKYHPLELCELTFGPNAQFCAGSEGVCRLLECRIPGKMECSAQQMPWPDFTSCGHNPNQQCFQGTCVWINATHISRRDGGWGPWSAFSECSRPCGGGIRKATHECSNPRPANGGRYCIGERTIYRSCNTHPCPGEARDFRSEQCAKFNNKTFNISGLEAPVEWLPRYTGIETEKCKLFCTLKGTDIHRNMKINVVDGTPCSPDSNDICANGKCMPAGCDGVLYSTTRLDACGVCGGDNSTCQEVSVQLNNLRVRYGYNPIVRIPRGAANIEIIEKNSSLQDQHYLALRGSDGIYIINGETIVSSDRTVATYAGTEFEYSGSKYNVERINASKPISRPIQVEILSGGDFSLPEIRYRYTVANNFRGGRAVERATKQIRAVAESTCTCKCDVAKLSRRTNESNLALSFDSNDNY